MSNGSVERVRGVGMVTLRGDPAELGAVMRDVVGLDPPERRSSVAGEGGLRLLWMSPDELLLACAGADAPRLARALSEGLVDAFATVAVVSDARAVFDVRGGAPHAALARLMPVDFDRMAEGEVRRTRLAQVAAATWREGDAMRVVCFRSVADYVEAALRNAAADAAREARAGA